MKRALHPAVEEMHQVEALSVGLVSVNRLDLMTALNKALGSFTDLNTVSASPFSCGAVIDQKDSHAGECLMATWDAPLRL
ncbi:hypothetical protein [Synechococcus sp. BS55D]|uniref:hypothetical protein n=1 Tax=Synechococcus sp. BS55D TaxID=2055943 RepID=UPI001F42664D|nr:hypothetical protein [Synechococcus sp. BS55D]